MSVVALSKENLIAEWVNPFSFVRTFIRQPDFDPMFSWIFKFHLNSII